MAAVATRDRVLRRIGVVQSSRNMGLLGLRVAEVSALP